MKIVYRIQPVIDAHLLLAHKPMTQQSLGSFWHRQIYLVKGSPCPFCLTLRAYQFSDLLNKFVTL